MRCIAKYPITAVSEERASASRKDISASVNIDNSGY